MQYEKTAVKNSKGLGKTVALNDLKDVNTSAIVWHLVKRHKFGLVSLWAVTITVLYFVPFAPDLIMSAF